MHFFQCISRKYGDRRDQSFSQPKSACKVPGPVSNLIARILSIPAAQD